MTSTIIFWFWTGWRHHFEQIGSLICYLINSIYLDCYSAKWLHNFPFILDLDETAPVRKGRKLENSDNDNASDFVDPEEVTSASAMSRKRRHLTSESVPPFLLSFDSVDDMEDYSMSSNVNLHEEDDYEFATHVVKVKRSGHVIDVKSLWEMEGNLWLLILPRPIRKQFRREFPLDP